MGNGFDGAKFVCSPPLRPADHQAELWTGLVKDDLQVVSTDHCPFDFHGQKDLGKGDFRKVPNGLPGVEDRVDLLHDGGVVGGRITKERWVEIISTAPAKLFGMYPRKGAIAVGSDADLVVYDPNAKPDDLARRRTTWTSTTRATRAGPSRAGPTSSCRRGSVIVRDGEFTGRKGHGRFVKRGDRRLRPDQLSLRKRARRGAASRATPAHGVRCGRTFPDVSGDPDARTLPRSV